MIKITLSSSLKGIISDTLNDNFEKLKNGETKISSTSNKPYFDLSFQPNKDIRTLPVLVKELDNLTIELIEILPEKLYVSNIRFNK